MVLRRPGNNKATVIEGFNLGLVLVIILIGINTKGVTNFLSGSIEHLGADFITASTLAAVIAPGHDKTTIFKAGHIRIILGVAGIGINHKLFANSLAVGVEAPAINVRGRAAGVHSIVRRIVIPGNNETTIGQGGYRRFVLTAATDNRGQLID